MNFVTRDTLKSLNSQLCKALERRGATLTYTDVRHKGVADFYDVTYELRDKAGNIFGTESLTYRGWQARNDGGSLGRQRASFDHKTGGQALAVCNRILKKVLATPEDAALVAALDEAEKQAAQAEYADSLVSGIRSGSAVQQVRWLARGAGLDYPAELTAEAFPELLAAAKVRYPAAFKTRDGELTVEQVLEQRAAVGARLETEAAEAELAVRKAEQAYNWAKREAELARQRVAELSKIIKR